MTAFAPRVPGRARGRSHRRALAALVALLASGATVAQPEPAASAPPRVEQTDAAADARRASLQRDVNEALQKGDLPAARAALEALIEATPENDSQAPMHRYNLACVRARLGETEQALAGLEDAISIGFVDFFHLSRDRDLASLRDTGGYRLLLAGWRDLLDARGEADLGSARDAFGASYRFARDERLRLNIASCFDERSTSEALAEIRAVARWAAANLFGEDALPPEGDDGPTPHHWVTLILPTPAHFVKFVPTPGVGGVYEHDRRILVAQELGASLRHEFVHVLHHRRMSRSGQSHAWWAQEGLASLVEDVTREGPGAAGESGNIRPAPSWRTNIAKRLAARNALTPWRTLFAMPHERFVSVRPIANYSQARAVTLFLLERGALQKWMEEYERSYRADPTGLSAVEAALGKPAADAERDYRAWLLAFPVVAEEIRPGMASLGVVIGAGSGEGPVVEDTEAAVRSTPRPPGAGANAERLRRRDVITAIGGEATRTMEDVVRALSEREVGETVSVSVRRGTLRLEIPVTLRAQSTDAQ